MGCRHSRQDGYRLHRKPKPPFREQFLSIPRALARRFFASFWTFTGAAIAFIFKTGRCALQHSLPGASDLLRQAPVAQAGPPSSLAFFCGSSSGFFGDWHSSVKLIPFVTRSILMSMPSLRVNFEVFFDIGDRHRCRVLRDPLLAVFNVTRDVLELILLKVRRNVVRARQVRRRAAEGDRRFV
jgi:hypothetical protein